jgi:hypothetical protein
VHCYGINGCKGQGSCKGLGFKGISAAECLNEGGTIGDL